VAAGYAEETAHHIAYAEEALAMRIIMGTGAPIALLRRRLGEQAWSEAYGRMLEAVRRRIPATGMDVSAEAMLTSGTR
jgi:hypothetical protein